MAKSSLNFITPKKVMTLAAAIGGALAASHPVS